MALRGSANRYGGAARAFHWTSAVLILATIPLGIVMQVVADPDTKLGLYQAHVAIGGIVIALTVGRLAWLFFDRRPEPPQELTGSEKAAAGFAYAAFYLLLFVLAGSGVVMVLIGNVSSGLSRGLVADLGLEDVLFGPRPELALTDVGRTGLARAVHGIAARIFVLILLFHGGLALWHRFVRHDTFLARMLPRPWEPAGRRRRA